MSDKDLHQVIRGIRAGKRALTMHLELPEDIVRRAETNTVELLSILAIQLYADNRLDYADALRLSGLAPPVFNQELIVRALSIQQYQSRQNALRHTAG